ncbi:hypothetical protein BH10BAC5_BH10BAC5_03470 [soil metagenome]
MKKMRIFKLLFLASFLVSFYLMQGCGDGPSASTDNGDNMSFGMTEQTIPESSGLDTIIITSVKAMISKVEMFQSYNSEYQLVVNPPLVVNLTPGMDYQNLGAATIANGLYSKVRFILHQPASGEVVSDPEFNSGPLITDRQSVIIKGTFNNIPFTFKSHISSEINLTFPSLIELDINPLNVTTLFKPSLWFKSSTGSLLNPLSDTSWDQIDINIKNSFTKAFLDSDKNGSPD